jgi:hypothetical protein
MPLILVGYGNFEDYRLKELPMEALEQLAARYPLAVAEDFSPEYDDLIITVAIHAELARRRTGGLQESHIPSRRELAQLIVKRGFQQASKQQHPDGTGHHDAQVRLAQVRDELLENCASIPDDRPDNAIIIPAPPERRDAPQRAATRNPWDDEVPF